ncbi:DUF1684 domain-containing protein [Streptomyces sp. NPDC086777]|uniref:DUF1684 domain-containing protein n=1 Tax=Streptomyces sp. NPDC086777 TaxID=3154866 RepID=UPI00344B3580
MNADAAGDWKRRHEHRAETVSAPYGPLALVGSLPQRPGRPGGPQIEDRPDGRLPAVPGRRELTLQVAEQPDGRVWAVFAGTTGGAGSFRFRFLYSAAPAADGSTAVDFNRAQLRQCAFADHFICPFPPPGNTLDLAA